MMEYNPIQPIKRNLGIISIFLYFILAIACIILILGYLNVIGLPRIFPRAIPPNSPDEGNKVVLPINPKYVKVRQTEVFYDFAEAQIVKVDPDESGYYVNFYIPGLIRQLPTVRVTHDRIKSLQPSGLVVLSPGQKVALTMVYNLETRVWRVNGVSLDMSE